MPGEHCRAHTGDSCFFFFFFFFFFFAPNLLLASPRLAQLLEHAERLERHRVEALKKLEAKKKREAEAKAAQSGDNVAAAALQRRRRKLEAPPVPHDQKLWSVSSIDRGLLALLLLLLVGFPTWV